MVISVLLRNIGMEKKWTSIFVQHTIDSLKRTDHSGNGLGEHCLHYKKSQVLQAFEVSEVRCGQVWWPILGICALHFTPPSAHTHTTVTHKLYAFDSLQKTNFGVIHSRIRWSCMFLIHKKEPAAWTAMSVSSSRFSHSFAVLLNK